MVREPRRRSSIKRPDNVNLIANLLQLMGDACDKDQSKEGDWCGQEHRSGSGREQEFVPRKKLGRGLKTEKRRNSVMST